MASVPTGFWITCPSRRRRRNDAAYKGLLQTRGEWFSLGWPLRSLGLVKDTAGLSVADQGTPGIAQWRSRWSARRGSWQDWPKLAADCASFGDERFKQAEMVHREAVPLWVGSVGL